MTSTEQNQPQKKSLDEFYNRLLVYEFRAPDRAIELLTKELLPDLHLYTGRSPHVWHNTTMVAARVYRDATIPILECGLEEWPDSVDLLCDLLQYSYGLYLNLERAKETWSRLEQMDRQATGSYWRFWSYGAIYHAGHLMDVQRAVELLDEGMYAVKRDSLMDIINSYDNVLADTIPKDLINSREELTAYHDYVFNTLVDRYQLGLRLGVENGYVLAIRLASLYQEWAAKKITVVDDGESDMRDKSNPNLRKALQFIELAERMYTGNANHRVEDIYTVKVRLLIALREYEEAYQILKCLPERVLNNPQDDSFATLRKFAAEKLGIETDDPAVIRKMAIEELFAADGQALIELFAQDRNKLQLTAAVVQAISNQEMSNQK